MNPTRVLIAALGGEGGGVLASWIADAATIDGLSAQRTSVPGVAQRTGGTTYYIELVKGDGRRPVLALSPAPGEVDLFISSELLETARLIQLGFVTPDSTFVISPVHRVFTIHEKIAMADGRADETALNEAIAKFAKASAIGDFAALARDAGCPLNAVLLGLAARRLPIAADAFREAIRRDGRAVEANLRGFESGLVFTGVAPAPEPAPLARIARPPITLAADVDSLPEAAREFAREGVARLVDFQDEAYARLYLDRLKRFAALPGADADFVAALARNLALRMSSEDTVRVAQLKLREARLARVKAEARARPGDIVHVTEYFKPGPDELFGILPPRLARPLLGFCERRGWSDKGLPLKVRTTGLRGFLALRMLSSMKGMRPKSLRAAEENAWIARWLALVERALAKDPAAAKEIVETARLVRGYGDSWKNGHANWRKIADEIVEPMLAGSSPHFADAVMQARIAANADPEGKRLAALIESLTKINRTAA